MHLTATCARFLALQSLARKRRLQPSALRRRRQRLNIRLWLLCNIYQSGHAHPTTYSNQSYAHQSHLLSVDQLPELTHRTPSPKRTNHPPPPPCIRSTSNCLFFSLPSIALSSAFHSYSSSSSFFLYLSPTLLNDRCVHSC